MHKSDPLFIHAISSIFVMNQMQTDMHEKPFNEALRPG